MYENWNELEEACNNCNECKLFSSRKNVVIGTGNKKVKIMFIGEGPGADEDIQGIPFVGRAGQLLNKAFEGVGLKREEVYIANIVKCRPPKYLETQINLVNPEIIVLLGSVAVKNILGEEYGITEIRGKWIEKDGKKIIATFHPAALLRDETKKIYMWKDLKEIKSKLKI